MVQHKSISSNSMENARVRLRVRYEIGRFDRNSSAEAKLYHIACPVICNHPLIDDFSPVKSSSVSAYLAKLVVVNNHIILAFDCQNVFVTSLDIVAIAATHGLWANYWHCRELKKMQFARTSICSSREIYQMTISIYYLVDLAVRDCREGGVYSRNIYLK